MEVALNTTDWRVLRQVLRARRPSLGSTLRLDMTRRTKDGTFLTALTRYGLLERVTKGKTPFDAMYSLTELGKHAAEYGIYEVSWEDYKAQREDDR